MSDMPEEWKDSNIGIVKVKSGDRIVMVSYDDAPLFEPRFSVWGYNGDGTSFQRGFNARDEADEAFAEEKKRLAPVFREITSTILDNI